MSATGASVAVVMSLEEARRRIGQDVVYRGDAGKAEDAVIIDVAGVYAFVRCRGENRHRAARPESLTLPADRGAEAPESLAHGDLPDGDLAASQARLNEIVAEAIRGAPSDPKLIATAAEALRDHNWASGFMFKGLPAEDGREDAGRRAMAGTWQLESMKRSDAIQARWASVKLQSAMPPDAAALLRRLKAEAPALVYVITHAALGAAKIGVSDALGSRIAEHRREGWQLLAAFQVAAYAACAIEDDVLRWWRGDLGLPPFLRRDQMPRGGWTETVATGRVDLAATVAHVCELALLPEAEPVRE